MYRRIPVLILMSLVLAGCGEDGRYGFTFVNQGDHVIETGQVMTSDVAIAGGDVMFEEGSTLVGSLYLFGGELTVDSEIEGDVAALGGTVTLTDNARILGDFYVAGSEVTRSPEATIVGTYTSLSSAQLGGSTVGATGTIVGFLFTLITTTLIGASLSALAVWLMPTLTKRISTTSTEFPLISGALGLLLLLVLPMLLVFMAFTIVLLPGALIGLLVLGILVAYGVVGLARGIGDRLFNHQAWNLSPAMTTAAGAAMLIAIVNALSAIPFVAEISLALIAALAIGSVVLSGLGRRVYEPPRYDVQSDPA